MEISNLNQTMYLNIFKCKNVKSPSKSWEAAGWDFYIPENLVLADFIKSYKTYINESVIYNEESYTIPLKFKIKSLSSNGEFICILFLMHNNDSWEFGIRKYDLQENLIYTNIISEISKDEYENLFENRNETVITNIEIFPHSKVLIPSGIHVNLPDNVFLIADNKSGIAAKRGLIVGSDVIDVDYQGEIHIHLINTTNFIINISAGEKIVQLLPTFQPKMNNITEFSSLEDLYKDKVSQRGAGGFGSSGVK